MPLQDYLKDIGMEPVHMRTVTVGPRDLTLHARECTADVAEHWFDGIRDADGQVLPENQKVLRNRIVAGSICDPDGNAVMTEQDVGQLPATLLAALAEFALEVNGLNTPTEEEEKET